MCLIRFASFVRVLVVIDPASPSPLASALIGLVWMGYRYSMVRVGQFSPFVLGLLSLQYEDTASGTVKNMRYSEEIGVSEKAQLGCLNIR